MRTAPSLSFKLMKGKDRMKTKKVALLGISIALAMILSYLESQIPSIVPGVKIGLANLAIVFILYRIGWREAIIVSTIRVLMMSFLFGNGFQVFMFSIVGAVLSLAGMILLKQIKGLSPVVVSISGGILHNVGQTIVACVMLSTKEYVMILPILLVSGIISGTVIGIISGMLVKRSEKWKF